jgi:hypothetical protein
VKLLEFKNQGQNNPLAPVWRYFIFEASIKNIDLKNLSKYLLKKEKDILKLKISNDGYTGLNNHTTTRHKQYNLFNFKHKEIDKLKKQIIKNHNKFIQALGLKLPKTLYGKCWYNIMNKNEAIKAHAHSWNADTYLGGHFCVQCNNTSTYYINSINQLCDPTAYQSKNEEGKLTLFQNFIPHYTDKHKGDSKRITIAFDLAVVKINNNYIVLHEYSR